MTECHQYFAATAKHRDWTIAAKRPEQLRIALVLVYSDYASSDSLTSLPGAEFDGIRMETALRNAGYQTKLALDPENIVSVLDAFSADALTSEAAIIYATGHGVHVNETTYLLMSDYMMRGGKDGLADQAISANVLSTYACAKSVNLLFFGGCRNNPFR
jgi:hypothetical protein